MRTSRPPLGRGPERGAALTRREHLHYAPLVHRIARAIGRRAPGDVTEGELCAPGFRGLAAALAEREALGPTLDAGLIELRVRSAMLDHVRGADPTARNVRHESRTVTRAIRALLDVLGGHPTRPQIAWALGLSVERYESTMARIFEHGLARIDVPAFDDPHACGVRGGAMTADITAAFARLPADERALLSRVCEGDVDGSDLKPRSAIQFTETIHRLRAALGRE